MMTESEPLFAGIEQLLCVSSSCCGGINAEICLKMVIWGPTSDPHIKNQILQLALVDCSLAI